LDQQGGHKAQSAFHILGVFEALCDLLLLCLGLRCVCGELINGDVFQEACFVRVLARIFSIVRSERREEFAARSVAGRA
jgi:hypothetical protein